MDIVYVSLCALGSIVTIFIITKLMGNRQLSQISMFDYINGITIGSIAAEMATDIEEFHKPLIALVVYGAVSILVAYVTNKSLKIRRFMEGKTLLLYEDGKIYEKNLMKAGIDIDEFMASCRVSGYFDLQDIYAAYLETCGKISFLPMEKKRPATPEDLAQNPSQTQPVANVIIDGVILYKNLQLYGKDVKWLENQLQSQKVKDISEVVLATCDRNNKFTVYVKTNTKKTQSIFE